MGDIKSEIMNNIVMYTKYLYKDIPIRIFGVQHFKKSEKRNKNCPIKYSTSLKTYLVDKIKSSTVGNLDIYLETNYIFDLKDNRSLRGINYFSYGLESTDPLLETLNINQKCFYEDKRDLTKFYLQCPEAFSKDGKLVVRFHYIDARFTENKDQKDPNKFLFELADYISKTKNSETINILFEYIEHCIFNTPFYFKKSTNNFVNKNLYKYISEQKESAIFKKGIHRITLQLSKLDVQTSKIIKKYFENALNFFRKEIEVDPYESVLNVTSTLMDSYFIARMMRFIKDSNSCIVIAGLYHAELYSHFIKNSIKYGLPFQLVFESEANYDGKNYKNCSKFVD